MTTPILRAQHVLPALLAALLAACGGGSSDSGSDAASSSASSRAASSAASSTASSAAASSSAASSTASSAVSSASSVSSSTRAGYYATKTNYQPQQAVSSYEAAPAGFTPVYTQLVARHGTRGLSSMKYDDAVLNMWTRAKADGALTALGEQLGPDVEKIMKANFLMGYGVSGISTPGYGNLTQVGVSEHKQLAVRLASRMNALFAGAGSRKIEIMNSGQDRAVDSSTFFSGSLASTLPAIAANVTTPVVNRYQLYFHKLSSSKDAVTDTASINYAVLQASLAYQQFAAATDTNGYGMEVAAKIAAVRASAPVKAAARTVLERLFTTAFLDKIDAGTYSFSNNSTRSYTSADGLFTNSLTGDGKTKITSSVDAAALIYELYIIAPGMRNEAPVDFSQYMPLAQAEVFAGLQDVDDFYNKGPSATEYGNLTWNMAQGLLKDFFDEVSTIAAGDSTRAARLRFSHAENLIPFITAMGIEGAATQLPKAQTYSYDNNPWRGETVSPMATNVQWDVYRDSAGTLIVKMLFNEKEVDFRASCASARYGSSAHFYDFAKLKACYYPS
ncbi:histidine-type phosphatase [Uliginosibacterium paludis]|uniref:Multiple inositol polyphosphate phosphatase 1 n=1 Tax=Uliginosibacterium paludis TaxID=1615952 RepID=A0ABV2CM55_9RHOO